MPSRPHAASAINYRLIVQPPAARALASARLSEGVAAVVVAFITGPLLVNPRRVGHELRDDLAGTWSARRGEYRVLYRINDDEHSVVVVAVAHRRDAYRRH